MSKKKNEKSLQEFSDLISQMTEDSSYIDNALSGMRMFGKGVERTTDAAKRAILMGRLSTTLRACKAQYEMSDNEALEAVLELAQSMMEQKK